MKWESYPKVLVALILLAGVFTPFSRARSSPVDGDNSLERSFRTTLRGGVVAAGVGLAGIGEGNISINGLPAGSGVVKAFLYWATIGSANTFTSPTLDGAAVDGELIGVSGDTCWGMANNFVYRADVTALVDGNGFYTVAGLPGDVRLPGNNDSQGASLVLIYSDDSQPFRTLIIDDGAVTLDILNQHEYTDTISGFDADNPVTDAEVTYLMGDGQSQFANGNVTFNGTSIAENVFNGVDGDYWGTLTFDVTALSPTDPSTTTIHNLQPGGQDTPDCLLWAATVFSVTPPQPSFDFQMYLSLILG
jgi:hypothetical protein